MSPPGDKLGCQQREAAKSWSQRYSGKVPRVNATWPIPVLVSTARRAQRAPRTDQTAAVAVVVDLPHFEKPARPRQVRECGGFAHEEQSMPLLGDLIAASAPAPWTLHECRGKDVWRAAWNEMREGHDD